MQLWVEQGDIVRVIGTFCKENEFHLKMDDNYDDTSDAVKLSKASMVIVEPYIMIPTTQIVKAFPCTRKAYLSNQYKGIHGDINYALVLGNVIHAIFQDILAQMDFRRETINKIIKDSIRGQLLLLFSLQKNEREVEEDARRAVKNITEWLDMVLLPSKN
jgi:CRISPR/Cas system-associated exonuclease Cas4 (RecB family)